MNGQQSAACIPPFSATGRAGLRALRSQSRRFRGNGPEPFQVLTKELVLLNAVLKALELMLQLEAGLVWQLVNAPILVLPGFHESAAFEVMEVL